MVVCCNNDITVIIPIIIDIARPVIHKKNNLFLFSSTAAIHINNNTVPVTNEHDSMLKSGTGFFTH
jgi:hypothetical protein